MTTAPEILALEQLRRLCLGHVEALGEALEDMDEKRISAADLAHLNKADRRLLDQFAYRYTRLQDDMGARLMPDALRALGEEIASMPALDRYSRLEQLGWLPSADEWVRLRQIRHEFTHDDPDSPAERFERLQAATAAAKRGIVILEHINQKIRQRFDVKQVLS